MAETRRQREQEDARLEAVAAASRDADRFLAWWNEHKFDEKWTPGGPVVFGHVKRAFEAGAQSAHLPSERSQEDRRGAAEALRDVGRDLEVQDQQIRDGGES